MSNHDENIDDQTSRLKQFAWEELEGNLCLAVLFRSERRYIVQRYIEHELSHIQSSIIENQWRHCLFHCKSKSYPFLYLTRTEIELMHEIFSWHCNSPHYPLKLSEQIDTLIDFEDLLDTYHSYSLNKFQQNDKQISFIRPVTTLNEARRNIELWTNLQTNNIEQIQKQSSTKHIKYENIISYFTSNTGWIQLDSKTIPFIKKHCDRLLPVEYLLKEHIITSSEDICLRSLYIPSNPIDLQIFRNLLSHSSFNWINSNEISFITLDHLIFRLKRLFFIRFLSSPNQFNHIDYQRIMSYNGGLLTSIHSSQQRIPFIYINQQKYIPQLNDFHFPSISTFSMANQYELEYLRLISLYDYLSSEENYDYLEKLFSITNLTIIPIEFDLKKQDLTCISLKDFHFREYQRRTQQEKTPWNFTDDFTSNSTGWWQTPISSKNKQSLSHLKYQRPIFF